jgi:hypothetical protein
VQRVAIVGNGGSSNGGHRPGVLPPVPVVTGSDPVQRR